MSVALQRLQTEGYGIFRYTAEDTAKGVEPVFRLTQLAAWLGVSQFETLMKQGYGIQGRDKQRYFSVTALLSIQTYCNDPIYTPGVSMGVAIPRDKTAGCDVWCGSSEISFNPR